MVATGASSQQDGIWLVVAALAYFAYRFVSSVRTEERRRREHGQPHSVRDTTLLLLAAVCVVGLLLCATFLKPLNVLIHSRAGFRCDYRPSWRRPNVPFQSKARPSFVIVGVTSPLHSSSDCFHTAESKK